MFIAAFLLSGLLSAAEPDTLHTAVVSAERGISVSRTDTLPSTNIHSITDLLLQSPGLVVADNGGFAGLKTVNLRGLGTTHTSIRIDGIKVGNVQAGQPDLAMLGLENFSGAVIDYAQNSINFRTAKPVFNGRRTKGRLALIAGSFGTFLPQGRVDFRLSDRVSLSANAAAVISKGDFSYGNGQTRTNNDIRQMKAGVDTFGQTGGGEWTAKLFFNGDDRGTPGSTDWPSTDRQQDRNAFAQGLLRKRFSPLYSLNLSAKSAYDKVHYASEWGDSDYAQTEFQLNSAHTFNVRRWLDLSAVAELQADALESTNYAASRTAVTGIAAAAIKLQRTRVNLALEYGGTFDKGGASHNVVSPSADIRITAARGVEVFGFARRAYRTPTFNELYYPGFGNPELKPEDAWLIDAGVDFNRQVNGKWTVKAKLDAFSNHLTDKIVSAPTQENPSIWLPYNVGEVHSAGFDADAGVTFAAADWKADFDARYSFQDANDVPYVSKHTAVLRADASFKSWSVDAIWNWRGGRRDAYGEMPDWHTLDVVIGKTLDLRGCLELTLRLACRNATDSRHELVTGYPMPGRSLTGSIGIAF